MEYRSPAPSVAFALAGISGVLIARGSYVGGAIAAIVAVVLLALFHYSIDHGDEDRHTLW